MKIAILALLAFGSAAEAKSYRDAVTVVGADVRITQAAFDDIADAGLVDVMYSAASSPVLDQEGNQIGYRLSDIDPGSVFETVGIRNGDVVMSIDGIRLCDPRTAVDALRYAKQLDRFSVLVMREGALITFRVRVQ